MNYPFNVSLEIQVEAESPLEAAKQVQAMIQEKGSAWQFYVQEDSNPEIFSVDLEENEEDAILTVVNYHPTIQN